MTKREIVEVADIVYIEDGKLDDVISGLIEIRERAQSKGYYNLHLSDTHDSWNCRHGECYYDYKYEIMGRRKETPEETKMRLLVKSKEKQERMAKAKLEEQKEKELYEMLKEKYEIGE